MNKVYRVKHSLTCDELGLKQVDDIIETNNEELVARLGDLIEEVEVKKVIEDDIAKGLTDAIIGVNIAGPVVEVVTTNIVPPVGEDNESPADDGLETKTIEELIALAKEKGIKGNLSAYKETTLIKSIREIK